MKYLARWVRLGTTTIERTDEETGETTHEKLDAPRKIILLGDIIDLWVSRDPNIVRPYEESFNVVKSLIALDREIVYVVGNHDDLMRRFYPDQDILCDWAHVYSERYPEPPTDGRWKGEQIGDKTYLFLHGHQFGGFRYPSVLRLFNFMGSAASAAEGFWQFKLFGGIAFLLIVVILLSAFVPNPLFSALSGFTASLSTRFGAGVTVLSWLVLGVLASLGVLWAYGRVMRSYYVLYRHPGHKYRRPEREYRRPEREYRRPEYKPDYLALGVLWFWGRLMRLYYDLHGHRGHPPVYYDVCWCPRHNIRLKIPEIRQTIPDVARSRGFRREKPHIDADVVVFGHTHYPDVYAPNNGRIERLVNTGSWIEQYDERYDTFVYLDNSRGRLYRWVYRWEDDHGYVKELKRWSNR